jgi:hypothetical protein
MPNVRSMSAVPPNIDRAADMTVLTLSANRDRHADGA